jgi:hypothetical protein
VDEVERLADPMEELTLEACEECDVSFGLLSLTAPTARQHLPEAMGRGRSTGDCAAQSVSRKWWTGVIERRPGLFAHRRWVRAC